MEGEKLAAAAAVAAAGTKWSEEDRLTRSIIRYWLFLCIGFSVALMAPTLAPKMKHAAVPSLPAGLDLPATCLTFAAATVLLQRNFARVLERNPSMAMPTPRLTLNPLIAWPLAIFTWLFATACFVSYLSFGADYLQWAAAGVASGANLAMATRAVRRYRHVQGGHLRRAEDFNGLEASSMMNPQSRVEN